MTDRPKTADLTPAQAALRACFPVCRECNREVPMRGFTVCEGCWDELNKHDRTAMPWEL